MKKILVFTIILFITISGFSENEPEKKTSIDIIAAYNFGYQKGYNIDGGFAPISYEVISKDDLTYDETLDPGRDLGSSFGDPELKASIKHSLIWPMLVGSGPLQKDNNFQLDLEGELSPVSINGIVSGNLTPIAFLEIGAGGAIGTGWNIGFNGLGRNLPGVNNEKAQSEPFSGLVYRLWLETTFQFDIAAVMPGDWNHVLIAAIPKLQYMAYTGANEDEAWQYEADSGMNYNGLKFHGTYFVGYQMPIKVNTVGVLIETSQYIDKNADLSKMSDTNGWGSDFVELMISPLATIELNEKSELTVLLQFEKKRDYTDETIGYRYFGFRDYQDSYIYFKRIVFNYSYKF